MLCYRSTKVRPIILAEWVGRHIGELRTKKKHTRALLILCIQQAGGGEGNKCQNAVAKLDLKSRTDRIQSDIVLIAVFNENSISHIGTCVPKGRPQITHFPIFMHLN